MTWAEVYDGVDLGPVMGDPRFTLRGGRFKEVRIDVAAQRVLIIVNVGDLQVGYRRLRLRFDDARVVPDDYQRLSAAIRAEFKSDHWHRGRAITEVEDQRVEAIADGRHRLTLRLWPFHKFAIEFGHVLVEERPLTDRGPARPGKLRVSSI